MASKEKPATFLVLKNVRLSYAHIFEKFAFPAQPGKPENVPMYSTKLIWPKTNTALTEQVKAKILKAMDVDLETDKPKLKGKTIKSKDFQYPLYDGDNDDPVKPELAGHWYITCKSSDKPGVVDMELNPILDKEQVQSGDHVNVSVNFYAFNNVAFGVGIGLGNVQFIKQGDRFTNRTSAEDDFGDIGNEEVEEGEDDVDSFM